MQETTAVLSAGKSLRGPLPMSVPGTSSDLGDAYAFMNRCAERNHVRESGHTFAGAGVAWTRIDDEPNGRLLSLQFGLSREAAAREHIDGSPVARWLARRRRSRALPGWRGAIVSWAK